MIYYPDTTLPPTESAPEYKPSALVGMGAPPKGLRGFGEKVESWQGFVGFNGLLWNIVRLNQPNANLMPISQKHRASLVNSTISIKVPQISQKNVTFYQAGRTSTMPTISPKPRIYATCNTHSRICRKGPAAQRFFPCMCYAT